jgi:hypothetical protein
VSALVVPGVTPVGGVTSEVRVGGQSVVALGAYPYGGYLINPAFAPDQGLDATEDLYVDPTGPAGLNETGTTVAVPPGGYYRLPPGSTSDLWVNAASSGHLFTAVGLNYPTQYPPTPTPSPFPPAGPTGLTKLINSYLYEQYADDDDLQAFTSSFNTLAQSYLDTFNALSLPVYTGPLIVGSLLDWVALGLYGLARPALSSGKRVLSGPLNTYEFNTWLLNKFQVLTPSPVAATSDDIFKRILTWHLYKGDGKVFTIRWLKRRILRFLLGVDGTDPRLDNSYQVSVTFAAGSAVSIRLVSYAATLNSAALLNSFRFNAMRFNETNTTVVQITPLPNAETFKEAADAGVLELPFQYDFTVTI